LTFVLGSVPRGVAALTCVTGLAVLCGCGGDAGRDPDDPYAEEFEQFIESSTSAFVRGVLADHEVDDGELSASLSSFVVCLQDRGVPVTVEEGATLPSDLAFPIGVLEERKADHDACSALWVGGIETLYEAVRLNPENRDMDSLVADCLVREGLAPDGFGEDELRALRELSATKAFVPDGGGQPTILATPSDPDPTLPGGARLYGEEAEHCFEAPRQQY
jgi:hypothetical protein